MLVFMQAIQDESDRNIVEEIYSKHSSTMLYIAQGILKDRYLAEDAVSQAFIKIIENLQKFSLKNCKKTRALVVIIVRNICYNMLKGDKKETVVSCGEFDDITEDIANTPLECILKEETYDFVLSCLSQLDTNYQDVLSLKLFFEYTDNEISKVLSITPNNVYVRLHRAKKALIKEIRKRRNNNG